MLFQNRERGQGGIPLSNMRANVKSGRDFNIGGRMFESFHHSAFRRFQRFALSLN